MRQTRLELLTNESPFSMDVFDAKKRSEVMSRIRSSGTKPEERMHSLLVSILGRRRKIIRHSSALPGRPDFLIPSLNLVIFVDGCFYHNCPKHGRFPETNQDYWIPKILRNVRRDARNRRKIRALGYAVWRAWEHDLKGRSLDRTERIYERRLLRRVHGNP